MKRIDFEFHGYLPEVFDVMAKRKDYPYYDPKTDVVFFNPAIEQPHDFLRPNLTREFEDRVAKLDEGGISMAVLSSSPGVEELGDDAIEMCRKTNNWIYEHTKRFPDRFKGSATLPVMDADAACDELKRCVQELGFVAWHAHACFCNIGADDPRFRPIFKTAEELGVYVYLHPALFYPFERVAGFDFPFAGPALGFTINTQLTLLRLMLDGAFDDMPDLKIMTGHLGEALPFLLERISNRLAFSPSPSVKMQQNVKYYFANNIYVTTSGNCSKDAFECTKNVLGIDHILYGSDYPFEDPREMRDFTDSLSLTTEEREKLYFKNAEKFINK